MLNHLTTYTLILVNKSIYNMTNEEIAGAISPRYNYRFTPDQIDTILNTRPPRTKQIVHELYDLGFQNSHISRILGIGKGVVSYHLREKKRKGWVSPLLHNIQEYNKGEPIKNYYIPKN